MFAKNLPIVAFMTIVAAFLLAGCPDKPAVVDAGPDSGGGTTGGADAGKDAASGGVAVDACPDAPVDNPDGRAEMDPTIRAVCEQACGTFSRLGCKQALGPTNGSMTCVEHCTLGTYPAECVASAKDERELFDGCHIWCAKAPMPSPSGSTVIVLPETIVEGQRPRR